jgi:hypothetical protein
MRWLPFLCLFPVFSSLASPKIVAINYVIKPYAIIHENPGRYSTAQTSVTCGFPVKILADSTQKEGLGWYYVQAGEYQGYIQSSHVATNRNECIQEKYPKFFSSLNLDLNELYHYGKLFDQINQIRPKVQ